MNGWISVNDELPPLCATGGEEGISDVVIVAYKTSFGWIKTATSLIYFKGQKPVWRGCNPSHWQYFPADPE